MSVTDELLENAEAYASSFDKGDRGGHRGPPPFALEAFPDLDADVRQSVSRIRSSPFIPRKDSVDASSTTWSRALREVT